MDDFENYIDAMDIDYDSEDVIFTRYVFKSKIPQFKVVKQSVSARSTIYMKENFE